MHFAMKLFCPPELDFIQEFIKIVQVEHLLVSNHKHKLKLIILVNNSYFTTGQLVGRSDAGYIKNKDNLSLQAKLDLKLRVSLAIRI